jgi:hypothetical protein
MTIRVDLQKTFNLLILSCLVLSAVSGCSKKPKVTANEASSSSPDGPLPNTTDVLSVDQSKGTFVALARRDQTTHRIIAKCGIRCPIVGKNFAGFWSLPASQTTWDVIEDTEMQGLRSE